MLGCSPAPLWGEVPTHPPQKEGTWGFVAAGTLGFPIGLEYVLPGLWGTLLGDFRGRLIRTKNILQTSVVFRADTLSVCLITAALRNATRNFFFLSQFPHSLLLLSPLIQQKSPVWIPNATQDVRYSLPGHITSAVMTLGGWNSMLPGPQKRTLAGSWTHRAAERGNSGDHTLIHLNLAVSREAWI